MSWDICIMKLEKIHHTLDEVAKDAKPLHLGKPTEVQQKISEVFHDTDWSDFPWGVWRSEEGSIEFNIGREDHVDTLMLHVRAGEVVVAGIIDLAQQNGWQALDFSDGTFLDQKENPVESLRNWRNYRDQVVKGGTQV